MLVTSIFSFFHNVFKRLLPQGCQKSGLCGKGLKHNLGLENALINSLLNIKILDQSRGLAGSVVVFDS